MPLKQTSKEYYLQEINYLENTYHSSANDYKIDKMQGRTLLNATMLTLIFFYILLVAQRFTCIDFMSLLPSRHASVSKILNRHAIKVAFILVGLFYFIVLLIFSIHFFMIKGYRFNSLFLN